ncbi:putative F-box protein At1g49610 [Phalaenopsis equestris]|uniref:putative F-box protein At1g49610 n=1 Tax=Phalaenopsis equestris TaxID=78828 RepID=UPI0009E281A4|nr:putative F-box protein At1g49610 [Phalaenopsis equestris]XP_020593990.1 putative F-box protein At1g49610 [Phalaenopsis equestris]XP_020593991.1 putative F-box protein At1g49610 [Phalaenopsis equestris]
MVDDGKVEICDRHSRRPSKFRVSDREESFDRLSDLPDALLLQILSYFSLDDAITTSLLSRRWRNLWKWIDNLDFPMQCGKSKRNSLQFIERSLSLHEGIKIKRFCARFRYNSNFISHVDSWVRFAVARNVEKLVLDPFYVENGVQPYMIPVNLYKCGSLKELEVNLCRFSPPPSFLLRSLTKLTINNTVFAGDTLKTLISGCPALEELALVNCNQARDLEVVVLNRNLERMKIVEFPDEMEEGTEVKIYAPYLLHLELQSGDFRPCVIQDASSIVSAWLDLRKMVTCLSFNAYNQKNYCKILVNIMIGLHEVETLRLSSWCVQALLAQEDLHSCLPTTLQNLKHLKLDVQLTKEELPGIACLLSSSPELESLNIQLCRQAHMDKDMINPTDSNRSEWSFWDSHESSFYSLKYNLKKVLIENFKGEENEMRFLAFLLRNSIVLKQVVISMSVQPLSFTGSGEAYVEYCSKPGRASKKYLQSIRKLMEYPRPPQTEILFFGSQPACF